MIDVTMDGLVYAIETSIVYLQGEVTQQTVANE
jgi:hypothetical protein